MVTPVGTNDPYGPVERGKVLGYRNLIVANDRVALRIDDLDEVLFGCGLRTVTDCIGDPDLIPDDG
ncbi:MAG: hypothetical protein H0W81_02145 [Chloroflexi bacterium]|nr:hypothetical protein [Chloroflexota bacterium]